MVAKKQSRKSRSVVANSTQNEFVQCDLEFPQFQIQIASLQSDQLDALFRTVEKINQMTWQQIYQTSSKGSGKRGINYEVIQGQKIMGIQVHSIRLTDKIRARVIRNGVFLRFISIHPDHDSAYK